MSDPIADDPRRAQAPYADLAAERAAKSQAAEAVGFEGLTVEQLREEAKARGLPVSGTKAELLSRLADTDQQPDVSRDAETAED